MLGRLDHVLSLEHDEIGIIDRICGGSQNINDMTSIDDSLAPQCLLTINNNILYDIE